MNLTNIFTNIANAIREKTGSKEKIKPVQMADAIKNIGMESIRIEPLPINITDIIPWVVTEIEYNSASYLVKDYYYDTKDIILGTIPKTTSSTNNIRSYIFPVLDRNYQYIYLCADFCAYDGVVRVAQFDNNDNIVAFNATYAEDNYNLEKNINGFVFTIDPNASKIQFFARNASSKWACAALFCVPLSATVTEIGHNVSSYSGVFINIAEEYIGKNISEFATSTNNQYTENIEVSEGEKYIYAGRTYYTNLARYAMVIMLSDDETLLHAVVTPSNGEGIAACSFTIPPGVKYIRCYQRHDGVAADNRFMKLYKIE